MNGATRNTSKMNGSERPNCTSREAGRTVASRWAATSRMISMSVPKVVARLPRYTTEATKAYCPKPLSPRRRAIRMVKTKARACEPRRPTKSQPVFFATRPASPVSSSRAVSSSVGLRFIAERDDEKIAPPSPGAAMRQTVVQPGQGAIKPRMALGEVFAFGGGRDHGQPFDREQAKLGGGGGAPLLRRKKITIEKFA